MVFPVLVNVSPMTSAHNATAPTAALQPTASTGRNPAQVLSLSSSLELELPALLTNYPSSPTEPKKQRMEKKPPKTNKERAKQKSEVMTESQKMVPEGPVTTLVIRNLPDDITQSCLIDELNRCGFDDTYDFAYLPQCFHTRKSLGFAFVNFCEPHKAGILVGQWHQRPRFGQLKPLNIKRADVQGLEANLAKWMSPRLRRIRDPTLWPFVRNCSRPFHQRCCHTVAPGPK